MRLMTTTTATQQPKQQQQQQQQELTHEIKFGEVTARDLVCQRPITFPGPHLDHPFHLALLLGKVGELLERFVILVFRYPCVSLSSCFI